MHYDNIVEGTFIARPNRFVAKVSIYGVEETVHVKNTGRCKELLIPGARVFLQDFRNNMGNRKLRFSLISVEKTLESDHDRQNDKILINMDSQITNKVIEEALLNGSLKLKNMGNPSVVQRERTFGNSRFDFYVEDDCARKSFIEVKGVTLEDKGIAKFPDAPTSRGVKHVRELISAAARGYNAYVVFLIQMNDAIYFTPNYETDIKFGTALKEAVSHGVHLAAYSSDVTFNSISLKCSVPIIL